VISEPEPLAEIRASWNGVRVLRQRLQSALLGSFALGGWSAIFAADAAHNLPLVHAFSALNDVLLQLEREGRFSCRSHFLGSLLDASKPSLPWLDFDLVRQGASRRNDVAHRGEVLPRGECWRYVDAIEAEFLAWGVIEPPAEGSRDAETETS